MALPLVVLIAFAAFALGILVASILHSAADHDLHYNRSLQEDWRDR